MLISLIISQKVIVKFDVCSKIRILCDLIFQVDSVNSLFANEVMLRLSNEFRLFRADGRANRYIF